MNIEKVLSPQLLEGFDYESTKKNVVEFFCYLKKLEWEWRKLNIQKGLTAHYDFSAEYMKLPYIPIGKDMFALSAKEFKEEELKQYISTYYKAKSVLTEREQKFIIELFENRKREDEIVEIVDCVSRDSREFRNLRRSAVYKFADFLGLAVEKGKEGMKI